MDKTEMVILGVLVISVIILVYMLISYFLPSNSQSSQSGGFYSDTPVETNGSGSGGGIQVPAGGGNKVFVNP